MSIDWMAIQDAGGLGKGTPKAVEKMQRTANRQASDESENVKVKARSGGRCEVKWFGRKARQVQRCPHASVYGVHHMIFGNGKRARGKSILADHKQDVCRDCHALIHGHVLRRIGGDLPLWSDEYERVDR